MKTDELKGRLELAGQPDLAKAQAAAAVEVVANAGRAWRRSEIERSIGRAVEALMEGKKS